MTNMFTLKKLLVGAVLLISAQSYGQVISLAQARSDFNTSAGAGTAVTVRGVVGGVIHNIGTTGANNTTFYMQDKTGGVAVYDKNWTSAPTTYDVKVGDSVEVSGTTSEYYNLLQLGTLTALKRLDSGQKAPVPVSLSLTKAFTERYESVLVRVVGLTFATTGTFGAKGGAETVSDAASNQAVVYANGHTDLPGANKPSGKVNISGIISQYIKPAVAGDTTNGYELVPRSMSDFDTSSIMTGIDGMVATLQFEMFPNPAQPGNTIAVKTASDVICIEIFNTIGQVVFSQKNMQKNTEVMFNLSASFSSGIYLVKTQGQNSAATRKLIIE
jgi:hypothetical protein